jgi:hypothetical protein
MPDKQMQATLAAIREIQNALPVVIEGQKALAQVTRVRYLALVEQGFTPDQALALCKS